MPPAAPVYIAGEIDATFAMFHPAAEGGGSATAVLICPPFGWEELCSARARRAWAERLAADGHPALRIDFPSTGDSGGSPRDPDRLEAWTGSVEASTEWLREHSGCQRLALIGIGLGGMVALHAACRGAAIDDLILWAVPAHGRRFLREVRAFARLNTIDVNPGNQLEEAPIRGEQTFPNSSLEVGGFLLSAETVAAMEALDLSADSLPERPGRRVMMIERGSLSIDSRLQAHLADQGVAPTVARGPGYAAMMSHPQESVPPEQEMVAVGAWLADVGSANSAPTTGGDVSSIAPTTRVGSVRESAIMIEQPFGHLYGVLSEPPPGPTSEICVVLLNAGALRRIGPGRLWVDFARRWAARGVPSVRIDLKAIGDSDGTGDPYGTPELNSLDFVTQVVAVLDHLEQQNLSRRFVLAGLCSGAFWSFQAALEDERVSAVFMLNPRVLFWDDELEGTRSVRLIRKILRGSLWRRVLRGEIPLRRTLPIVRAAVRSIIHRRAGASAARTRGRRVDFALDHLRDTDRRLLFLFGGNEPLHDELEIDGLFERLDRWPNLLLEVLPGRDHTLRPIASQHGVAGILDREIDREIARSYTRGQV